MLILTTPNVQLKVQFAEILSAEGLLTAIRRIFGLQKFLAIRYLPPGAISSHLLLLQQSLVLR